MKITLIEALEEADYILRFEEININDKKHYEVSFKVTDREIKNLQRFADEAAEKLYEVGML